MNTDSSTRSLRGNPRGILSEVSGRGETSMALNGPSKKASAGSGHGTTRCGLLWDRGALLNGKRCFPVFFLREESFFMFPTVWGVSGENSSGEE